MAQGRATGLSLSKQIENITSQLDEVKVLFVKKMAEKIVEYSPVYSGTYVKGHNISTGRNVEGQFTGSYETHLESPSPQAERDTALTKLFAQADALPEDATNFTIGNTVPHAWKVEYAGWKITQPYAVYSRTRAIASELLQEAVNEVRGRST